MGGPIRVLHAVVNMNRGGAETLIMNLYRNMDRSNVQFDFLTCKPGVFDEEIQRLGGAIHRIPYISDVGHFGYKSALAAFFKEHAHYSVVHAHMDKMSGIILREAKKQGIPVRIAHSHNTSSEGGVAAKAYKWYAGQKIRSSVTHRLGCSSQALAWLFGQKSDGVILKNGIESDRFQFSETTRQTIREELNIPDHRVVLGHVGRFNEQKNHAYLLELFDLYRQKNNNAVLLLAGDGTLRNEIEDKVNQLNLKEHVKFLGVRSDIERLLQAFDVLVFPSLHEGLPVTLIEAQGAGLPCIISDVITREVDLGLGLVDFVSLHKDELWIDAIHARITGSINRQVEPKAFADTGFDIKETAGWAEGFYLNAIGR